MSLNVFFLELSFLINNNLQNIKIGINYAQ
jgi:hypothetical protein